MKLTPKTSNNLKLKRTLVYGGIGLAISVIVGAIIFFTANLGNNEETIAAPPTTWYNSPGTGVIGDWTNNSSWNGSAPPVSGINNSGITVNANDYITRNGNLDVNNNTTFTINSNGILEIIGNLVVNNNLQLNVNGTLIIRGSLITNNGANITINGGGTAQVEGNVDLHNNTTFKVDGYLEVGGNLTMGSGTFDGGGIVDIGGTGCTQHWTGNGGCNENVQLPVELLSFTATPENGQVILEWETATELNNDYFVIERSSNGIDYSSIAQISGNGTTKDISSYEFIDLKPLNGQSYYRLKQTDFDGTTEVFRPVYIDMVAIEAANTIDVYPNPLTGDRLFVRVAQPTEGFVYIFNQSGNEIFNSALDDFNTETELQLPANMYPGIYVVKVNINGQQESFKIIKK